MYKKYRYKDRHENTQVDYTLYGRKERQEDYLQMQQMPGSLFISLFCHCSVVG